jgi:hypothetical protein
LGSGPGRSARRARPRAGREWHAGSAKPRLSVAVEAQEFAGPPWCSCCPPEALPSPAELRRGAAALRAGGVLDAGGALRYLAAPAGRLRALLQEGLAAAVLAWEPSGDPVEFSRALVGGWAVARACATCGPCVIALADAEAAGEHLLLTRHGRGGCPNCFLEPGSLERLRCGAMTEPTYRPFREPSVDADSERLPEGGLRHDPRAELARLACLR